MSEKAKVAERLRRKEQEVQSLEEKLRAARVYVQALQDVLKLLDDDGDADSSADGALKPGSAVAQARSVILERGHPVHINDILVALGREATREARASLVSSLAAYVRRGDIFTRPAPNTFGLIEMPSEPTPPTAPPANFGQMTELLRPSSTRKVNLEDDDTPF